MTISQEEIKKIIEGSYLKADHIFDSPPTCLEISGERENQILCTLGNFSTVLALPKVGKTTFVVVLVSSLLCNQQISNFKPSMPEDKNTVWWFDTEQGVPECVRTIRAISQNVHGDPNKHPENLRFLSLRSFNKEIRLLIIDYIIKYSSNIGFVVIDGVRDLVSSINDEREATIIADNLLKWTQTANIHIMTILHQNKGDDNARGHLGSELMNKAETVISLKRDDNNGTRITVVEPKLTRHKEFESFAFTISESGKVLGSEIKTSYEPKNPKADQLTFNQIEAIFKETFKDKKHFTYAPMCDSLQKSLKTELSIEFGEGKIKQLLKWLKSENYLILNEETKTYCSNVPFK